MERVKKIFSIFISIKFSIILFVILALSMGIATFIENDFGTETARALVYDARWFELLWILFILNLSGNIFRYKMWELKKLPIFLFHFSFILIFFGAFLTRYFGYEGIMHIREGQAVYQMVSYDPFIQILAEKDGKRFYKEKKIFISAIGGNRFEEKIYIEGEPLVVKFKDFIPIAEKVIVEKYDGKPVLSLKIRKKGGVTEWIYLKDGEIKDLGKIYLTLNKKPPLNKPYFFIRVKNGRFYINSNYSFIYFDLQKDKKEKVKANIEKKFESNKMYALAGVVIIPEKLVLNGDIEIKQKYKPVREENEFSAVILELSYKGERKKIALFGRGIGVKGIPETVELKDIKVTTQWGSKVLELPFGIYLKDFVLKRYPGSEKASSYESHVLVIDEKNGVKLPYRIYMNHPLEYGGFKFYQSSYDQDEKGTILSVNYDPGVLPTYAGYSLLIIGLILNLLNPTSRAGRLIKNL
ncbi:cytochrome c biogenesis protein ResB [Persephonella sp.]